MESEVFGRGKHHIDSTRCQARVHFRTFIRRAFTRKARGRQPEAFEQARRMARLVGDKRTQWIHEHARPAIEQRLACSVNLEYERLATPSAHNHERAFAPREPAFAHHAGSKRRRSRAQPGHRSNHWGSQMQTRAIVHGALRQCASLRRRSWAKCRYLHRARPRNRGLRSASTRASRGTAWQAPPRRAGTSPIGGPSTRQFAPGTPHRPQYCTT